MAAAIDDPLGLLGAAWTSGELARMLALADEYFADEGAVDEKDGAMPAAPVAKGRMIAKFSKLKPRAVARLAATEAAPPPLAPTLCPACGSQMRRRETEEECEACGATLEAEQEGEEGAGERRRNTGPGRLRIVGPNSGYYQPDLDSSSTSDGAEAQRKGLFEEFLKYRQLYMEGGGTSISTGICEQAANMYHEVQQQFTKRSSKKRVIMAECLRRACIANNFVPPPKNCAAFMRLPTEGVAAGENFLRAMKAQGLTTIDVDQDMCPPMIATTFRALGLEGKDSISARDRANLRRAVEEVVRVANENNIGTGSVLRSKVAGATFAVLKRATTAGVRLPWAALTLKDFCEKSGGIRKNTIERFLDELTDYHSHFVEAYKAAGIDAAP